VCRVSIFLAKILTARDKEILVYKRRLWFVKDSVPYNEVRELREGDHQRIIGIPRISLSLVGWRCEHAAEQPEVLGRGLPYEMVAVGVL